MSKKYGYARCSLAEEKGQDLNRQVRELKAAGAEEIITEREHGDAKVKQNLDMLLDLVQPGDTIICCEVSRLSRSTQQLCEIVNIIKAKHLRLEILGSITIDCRNGDIDPMSQAFLTMSGVFAELELSIIRARVKSGMDDLIDEYGLEAMFDALYYACENGAEMLQDQTDYFTERLYEDEIPFLRYFNVFHIDQCEGLTAKQTPELPNTVAADQTAEAIIAGYIHSSGVRLNHEAGDRAFYRPSTDSITLPLLAQFKEIAEYYSTAFHEMVHSTGHKTRLDRLEKTAFFGSEAYSKEELIAEIGAATLVNHVGLETSRSFRNSAAYVQNWLRVLQNDKRFIVSAAGKAEKAVNLILGTAA